MMRIMLVEDNLELRKEFEDTMQDFPNMKLVAQTGREDEANRMLRKTRLDAVIVDLELEQGSGITFIENLVKLKMNGLFIAVVTNVVSEQIYKALRNLGVDYIYPKQSIGFEPRLILSVITISSTYAQGNKAQNTVEKYQTLSKEDQEMSLRGYINDTLTEMGFSFRFAGSKYVAEALYMVSKDFSSELHTMKGLYPEIAKKYNSSRAVVERAMRVAIEDVWARYDEDVLKKHYPFDWDPKKRKPTNLEFLRNMASKITRQ